jgi:hypothetical protein
MVYIPLVSNLNLVTSAVVTEDLYPYDKDKTLSHVLVTIDRVQIRNWIY